jgi:tetratricopeptide (TPR) repeat protein
MDFRRRSRVNWVGVLGLLVGIAGIGSLVYQQIGIPAFVQSLPFMPKTPTATPVAIDDGSASLGMAEALWQNGQLAEATQAYENAAKIATAAAETFARLAQEAASQQGSADASLRQTQAAQATARAAQAYAREARILALRSWSADMGAQAVERARRAIQLDPKSGEARAVLVLALDRSGQLDAGMQAAREALDLDANNAEAHAFLAEVYADKYPLDKRAVEEVQAALKLNDKSALAHRIYGYVLETSGDYTGAAAEYNKATTLALTLSPLYVDLGRVYYVKLGKFEDAITALRRASELDPTSPLVYTELGRCYYTQGDSAAALAQLQRAIAVDANYPAAHGYLGWVYYFSLKQYSKAIPEFQRALELGQFAAGRTAEYYIEMGWSYYFVGKCTDARPNFQKALDLLASQPDVNLVKQAQDGLNACPGK